LKGGWNTLIELYDENKNRLDCQYCWGVSNQCYWKKVEMPYSGSKVIFKTSKSTGDPGCDYPAGGFLASKEIEITAI
jgi:hypothetical protein